MKCANKGSNDYAEGVANKLAKSCTKKVITNDACLFTE